MKSKILLFLTITTSFINHITAMHPMRVTIKNGCKHTRQLTYSQYKPHGAGWKIFKNNRLEEEAFVTKQTCAQGKHQENVFIENYNPLGQVVTRRFNSEIIDQKKDTISLTCKTYDINPEDGIIENEKISNYLLTGKRDIVNFNREMYTKSYLCKIVENSQKPSH